MNEQIQMAQCQLCPRPPVEFDNPSAIYIHVSSWYQASSTQPPQSLEALYQLMNGGLGKGIGALTP